MSILERILISIYFPQFRSPNCSRFENLFISIVKKKNSLNKYSKVNTSKSIYPEKIVRNEDKRTSVEIKGIPMDMTKKEVRNFIEQYGNLNYLYIIKDPNDVEKKSSIAYVNLINYKSIIPLYMNLRNYIFKRNEKIYNIKVMYSIAQGKNELKQFLKQNNSYKYSD